MAKVSVLIPARKEVYAPNGVTVLRKTVDDVLAKARGEVEVIVAFDGPPYEDLPYNLNLRVLNYPSARGTKPMLNDMARTATGKYLFKLDAHCSVSEGFDVELQSEMHDTWVVAPRFYVLNPQTWQWQDERYYDYFMLPCPLTDPSLYRFQAGGHWPGRTRLRRDVEVDENMKLHGSSFFIDKSFFLDKMGGLDLRHPDSASGEDIEISLKAWLGPWDGRVMVNKRAWIAHMHKGAGQPRSWTASTRAINESYMYTANYWMRNCWPQAIHPIGWVVERFSPVPGWPYNWREMQTKHEQDVEFKPR